MASKPPDITVFNETGDSLPLPDPRFAKAANAVASKENCTFNFIELVYVDEEEIVRLNREYLGRDHITDIISFRYSEEDEGERDRDIEGTLFCCAPRIAEQAEELGERAEREFLRIFIHGLLHLTGYDDRTEAEKQKMTRRENYYLELLEKQR